MKIRQILSEIIWEEQYAAMKAAKRFPRDWIHFTQIPKLGINPSKTHRDPPGIYFYPCSWLLSLEASMSQYAVSYPYYFICRIWPTANSVNLSRMTMQRARAIATRNGWIADFDRVISSGVLRSGDNPMHPKLLKRPGGLFYAALDYLVNVEKRGQWLQYLRGVDALFDHGAGIISQNEVHQVCVIDRRILRVLEQGSNKDEWYQIHAQMMKDLASEFGGQFTFRHKIPCVDVDADGKKVRMEFDSGNWAIYLEYFRNGQWVRTRERYDRASQGDYENVLSTLRYYLKDAIKKSTPEGLTSYWSPERIKGLFGLMMDNTNRTFRSHQSNEGIWYSAGWDSGTVKAHIHAGIGTNGSDTLTLSAWLMFSDDRIAEAEIALRPGTDIRQAATELLARMWDQTQKNLPKANWNDPKTRSFVRFKFPFSA